VIEFGGWPCSRAICVARCFCFVSFGGTEEVLERFDRRLSNTREL